MDPLSSSLVMLCILGTSVVKSPKTLLLRLILSRSELWGISFSLNGVIRHTEFQCLQFWPNNITELLSVKALFGLGCGLWGGSILWHICNFTTLVLTWRCPWYRLIVKIVVAIYVINRYGVFIVRALAFLLCLLKAYILVNSIVNVRRFLDKLNVKTGLIINETIKKPAQ